MNDVLLGVIIGSSITLIGQVVTQVFQHRGMKWKKYQERLDLIFKERIEAYKVMNKQLYILSDAVSRKHELENVRKEVTSTWIDLSVYFPPRVSVKILKAINLGALQATDPDTRDKLDYAESLKQAKLSLQGLEDITWLPQKEYWFSNLWLHWTAKGRRLWH